ncbi:MAG: Ca2+/Na+ antiporter, partial [Myxococcota bacterium]
MTVPDGHTANIHQAAPWVRGSWVLWCVAMLVMVFAGAALGEVVGSALLLASILPLGWGIWLATRPSSRSSRWISLRRAVRLLALLTVALTLAAPVLETWEHSLIAWGA